MALICAITYMQQGEKLHPPPVSVHAVTCSMEGNCTCRLCMHGLTWQIMLSNLEKHKVGPAQEINQDPT